MHSPPHPDAFINTEIVAPLDLTVSAPAKMLRVPRPALSALLNQSADLSGDMALRAGREQVEHVPSHECADRGWSVGRHTRTGRS